MFNVIPTTRPQAQQTTALVNTLRDTVLPKEHATSYVTGTTAGAVDFTSQITGRLAWLILAVVAISFLLLTTAFRSVVIATKAAILNILSIGAAYGVIVAIFEWGWGKSVIGLQSTLPIPAYVPMLVFCIVFGLSMDYEVFLLSRVHEAWLATRDAHRAVAIGIGATARVITTAAAIMVVVFTSFVINTNPVVKMLAIGMAFAVLIDASLVRMCLVPAIMSLLGSHAWWMPRWMEPVVPQLHLEASPAAEAAAPEPAVAGTAGHPAESPAGQSRPEARTTHVGPDLTGSSKAALRLTTAQGVPSCGELNPARAAQSGADYGCCTPLLPRPRKLPLALRGGVVTRRCGPGAYGHCLLARSCAPSGAASMWWPSTRAGSATTKSGSRTSPAAIRWPGRTR